jgi:hypothetical protein
MDEKEVWFTLRKQASVIRFTANDAIDSLGR